MDRLWAPWRMSYVANPDPNAPTNFITHVDNSENDRENLVLCRTDLSIAILNRFPYNNGHLLVAPKRECAELEGLTTEELLDLQLLLRRIISAIKNVMKPDGFNVGLNLGKAAGAGLPQHLHWHIVPRWNGDTNFMTLSADVRVIVQSLDECWVQLRQALDLETK